MSAYHTLRAEVGTVHRGAFDLTLAPVLTIASGRRHGHAAMGTEAQSGAVLRHHWGRAAARDGTRANSIVPRAFGGNIDNKHFGAGATVHLPVFNPGGLLSVGDGHALQGDGEVCLTAIETGLAGTLRITLVKNTGIARPGRKRQPMSSPWRSIPEIHVAAASALREMIVLIERATGLSAADAYSLSASRPTCTSRSSCICAFM